MSFDKTLFLASLQPQITTTDLEGFGPVRLRQITVAENDIIRAAAGRADVVASEFGLRLLSMALIDDAGAAVFTPDDLQALRTASGTKIDSLIAQVLELNGYRAPPASSSSTPQAQDAKN